MYLVSACLVGINCRYDGKSTISLEIEELVRNGKAIALCPEVIAGLNIPRDSCEIIETDDDEKKVISKEKKDFTAAFKDGAQKTLALAKIIGIKTAILKSRSPSCGCGQVYDGKFNGTLKKGNGLTADLLIKNGIRVYTEENYKEIFGSGLNSGVPYEAEKFMKESSGVMLTPIGTMQIETERLVLRKFQYTDDEDMLKYWVSDPEIQSMYSEPVYTTKQDVKELLDKYISAYEKDNYYRWAIILKETGECIGQIAYFLVDNNNHFAEIEYCIGKHFQRKGLATEATKAIIHYGFYKMNLHKVQICYKSINIPSRKVIEKCGFVYEGTLRGFFYMDGRYVDRLYYSILNDEFIR